MSVYVIIYFVIKNSPMKGYSEQVLLIGCEISEGTIFEYYEDVDVKYDNDGEVAFDWIGVELPENRH